MEFKPNMFGFDYGDDVSIYNWQRTDINTTGRAIVPECPECKLCEFADRINGVAFACKMSKDTLVPILFTGYNDEPCMRRVALINSDGKSTIQHKTKGPKAKQ